MYSVGQTNETLVMRKRRHGDKDHGAIFEATPNCRLNDLEDLRKTFESMLEGKRPFDPH
ncbi:hypothetical protein EC991_002586, partial [Linnemannia zychae]